MACLQYVDYMDSLVNVDPFETFNLKNTLIALLSSRLEDPSFGEHEKQRWIALFADSSFWMSSTRVAMCLATMLRAKRYEELFMMHFNYTLEQWKKVSDFMSPAELTSVPGPLLSLITGDDIGPFRLCLDFMSKVITGQYKSHLPNVLYLWGTWKSGETPSSGLHEMLASFQSMGEVYKDGARTANFSILCALLIIKPEIKNAFRDRFSSLLGLGLFDGPVTELYLAASLLVFHPKTSKFELRFMRDGTEVRCKGPEDGPLSIVIHVLRNFRHAISAFIDASHRSEVTLLRNPKVFTMLTNTSETGMFFHLCEVICMYKVTTDNLIGDLETLDFSSIISSPLLSPHMRAVLLEGAIGMYLCQNHFNAVHLSGLNIEFEESLSRTVGALRGVKVRAEISTLFKFMGALRDSSSAHSEYFPAAQAMFMWAILPRIMDDDAGADDVIEALQTDVDLQTHKQFQLIRTTAFGMMLEYTSINHLRKVIPKLAMCGIQVDKVAQSCMLSPSRRVDLLSALFYSEAPSNFNLSMLLSVKHHAPEKSIEYLDKFFEGSAPLHPISLANAIVEAITTIGMGKEKNIELLSQHFLMSIFIGKTLPAHKEFFDRVMYELELSLHFSLLPTQIRFFIIDLLFINPKNREKEKKLLNGLFQYSIINSTSNRAKVKLQATAGKKQEFTLNDVSNPEPKKLPRTKPRPNQLSLLARKSAETSATKPQLADQVSDPVRPSRSRPARIDQKSIAGANGQKKHFQEQPKSQISSKANARQTKKEKVELEEPQVQNYVTTVVQPPEDKVEKEDRTKPFILTVKLLRKNANIQSDGHVTPNDHVTLEFRKYIEEEVSHGFLPFKLDKGFMSFLTHGKNKEQFKSSNWKHIREWKERAVWRPKLHTPIKVFVSGVAMVKIADLRDFVFQLTKEQVARLQALCYFSSLSATNTDKLLKRAISRRTLKFILSSGLKTYQIAHGWIQIPSIPKTFKEFSNAVATLTESPVTDSSEHLIIRSKRAKLSKVKDDIQAEEPVGVLVNDETKDVKEIVEQVIGTSDELERVEKNLQSLTKSNVNDITLSSTLPSNSSNKQNNHTALNEKAHSPSSIQLKVTSPVFIPKKSEEAGHLQVLNNFAQMKQMVTPRNYKQKLEEFSQLLRSGVEYVALDCEMTGLYTKGDEEEHRKDKSLVRVDNTNKLIKAVDHNMMFQLGLTVKTLKGNFSVWSFYTAPLLTMNSFTPDTFNFFFVKNNTSSQVDLGSIQATIYSIAMSSVSVRPFLLQLFALKTTLVLFSGYVDLMHVRKAVRLPFRGRHEYFESHMESDFYDVKQIALNILNKTQPLELLVQELYDGLEMNKEQLHDASFDSFLTALAFDRLKKTYGPDRMTKRLLFNYEMEYKSKFN